MSQSNDRPRLPLTWTRFDCPSVPVPSPVGDGLASARLPVPLPLSRRGDAAGAQR